MSLLMLGPTDVKIWIVATHKVGEPIEVDAFTTEAEADAAYEAIDFEHEPLMDCKRMFVFDFSATLGWQNPLAMAGVKR